VPSLSSLPSLPLDLLFTPVTKITLNYDLQLGMSTNDPTLFRNLSQNMNKDEFIEFYKRDSNRENEEFYALLSKYLIYVESDEQRKNIKYIDIGFF
jgi:hypothetical protein